MYEPPPYETDDGVVRIWKDYATVEAQTLTAWRALGNMAPVVHRVCVERGGIDIMSTEILINNFLSLSLYLSLFNVIRTRGWWCHGRNSNAG